MRTLITAVLCCFSLVIAIATLCGCGDFENGEIIGAQLHGKSVHDTLAPVTGIPSISVYYVGEKIGVEYAAAISQIEGIVRWSQDFYRNEMVRHGFGPKTFTIQRHEDGAVVGRFTPEYSIDYYKEHVTDGYRFGGLRKEIGYNQCPNYSDVSLLIFTDVPSNIAGEAWACESSGHAFIAEGAWYNDVVAHELGHVFQLHHDWRDGSDIMSYGQTRRLDGTWTNPPRFGGGQGNRTTLSYGGASWLNLHPAFNQQQFSRDVWYSASSFKFHAEELGGYRHRIVCEFDYDGYDVILDRLIVSELRNAVFLEANYDLDSRYYGNSVLRYIGADAFSYYDVGNQQGNHRAYKIEFEVEIPAGVTEFSMELQDVSGHQTVIGGRIELTQ